MNLGSWGHHPLRPCQLESSRTPGRQKATLGNQSESRELESLPVRMKQHSNPHGWLSLSLPKCPGRRQHSFSSPVSSLSYSRQMALTVSIHISPALFAQVQRNPFLTLILFTQIAQVHCLLFSFYPPIISQRLSCEWSRPSSRVMTLSLFVDYVACRRDHHHCSHNI